MVQITNVEFNAEKFMVKLTARDTDREDWLAAQLHDEQQELPRIIKTKTYDLTKDYGLNKVMDMLDYYADHSYREQTFEEQLQQLVGKSVNYI